MNMKKMLLAVVLILNVSIPAVADVAATDVVAKQRYPWNGLVDITCNVTGIIGETNGLKLVVAAVMPDTGNVHSARNFWVVQGGTNSTDREVHTNGSYRLLWDARADLGIVRFTNMVVRVNFDAHEKVQLWEGGPYWATTNIGAENPEDCGYYFWWGDTVGYKREGDIWMTGDGLPSYFNFDSGNVPTYNKSTGTLQDEGWIVSENGTYILASEHDAAHVQWGGDWRMPVQQELNDLRNKCDWTWTTQNGINGCIVRGKGDYASSSIFLPAAGYGWGALPGSADSGYYWSSTPAARTYYGYSSSYIEFSNGDCRMSGWYSVDRYYGMLVRPVQGFTK